MQIRMFFSNIVISSILSYTIILAYNLSINRFNIQKNSEKLIKIISKNIKKTCVKQICLL